MNPEDVCAWIVLAASALALAQELWRTIMHHHTYQGFALQHPNGQPVRYTDGEPVALSCERCPTRLCDCAHETGLLLKRAPSGTRMYGLTTEGQMVLLRWTIKAADDDGRDYDEPSPVSFDVEAA